jgi:hypothetical protein
MKTILWLALALYLGLAGCAPAGYRPTEPYEGPGRVPPWFYNYDPNLRQWYEMPYYNPYQM